MNCLAPPRRMAARVVLVGQLTDYCGAWEKVEIAASSREVRRGQLAIALTPQLFDLFRSLVSSAVTDRVVTMSELIDNLWGDDVDGGPDEAPRAIRRLIWDLRRRLAPIAMAVPCERTRGYELVILDRPLFAPSRVVRRMATQRDFRTAMESAYRAVLEGRCEDALHHLESALPAYQLSALREAYYDVRFII